MKTAKPIRRNEDLWLYRHLPSRPKPQSHCFTDRLELLSAVLDNGASELLDDSTQSSSSFSTSLTESRGHVERSNQHSSSLLLLVSPPLCIIEKRCSCKSIANLGPLVRIRLRASPGSKAEGAQLQVRRAHQTQLEHKPATPAGRKRFFPRKGEGEL
jgi:hypothetical protein